MLYSDLVLKNRVFSYYLFGRNATDNLVASTNDHILTS